MSGSIGSSDFDPSLPNNAAEAQAAKDAAKESAAEKTYSDTKARGDAESFWSSIFGGKDKGK